MSAVEYVCGCTGILNSLSFWQKTKSLRLTCFQSNTGGMSGIVFATLNNKLALSERSSDTQNKKIWLAPINPCHSKLALLKRQSWLESMWFQTIKHGKILKIAAKRFRQKLNLVTWKTLQRWRKRKAIKIVTVNSGNWLATFWLMKLQTLERPVTIKLTKSPYPPLQVMHLTITQCNDRSSAKVMTLSVLRLSCWL